MDFVFNTHLVKINNSPSLISSSCRFSKKPSETTTAKRTNAAALTFARAVPRSTINVQRPTINDHLSALIKKEVLLRKF
jgi:hypothetical protein